MLHIERVQLRGFKSFKRADIPLSKGFVCIAGPNGSGKSNICDAIRFGLGENKLKALRAKKVSDLISLSSNKAEVLLYLNGGREKYEVRRAIRGDGKTKYILNGKRMTRTAVVEALRTHAIEPNGHNVIA
ncbi:MAG: AAA family ATPase, partial [Candidatus Micrarchaeota archaeon]